MAWVNLSVFVFGGLLVAVPVVLHLTMRQKPKQLAFPALQFVQIRQQANQRQLRLRHWILLALRCLAVLIIAAALARPSVSTAMIGNWTVIAAIAMATVLLASLAVAAHVYNKGWAMVSALTFGALMLALFLASQVVAALGDGNVQLLGNQKQPVAAVLVFDASPRMQYVHQNQTRLDDAKEKALWLIRQLPDDSDIAVIDSRFTAAAFAVDRGAAARSVEGTTITNVPAPLSSLIADAIRLAVTSEKERREVYIFTDLTTEAWYSANQRGIAGKLEQNPNVVIQIVDVGVPSPRNSWLGQPRMASSTIIENDDVPIEVSVNATGANTDQNVELYIEERDDQLPIIVDGRPVLPKAHLRGMEAISVADGAPQNVEFIVRGLQTGIHHGFVKLSSDDALSFDNTRYFTVHVSDPISVLIVTGDQADGFMLAESLSPEFLRASGRALFRTETASIDQLGQIDLSQYDSVALLDPRAIAKPILEQLHRYVAAGGGLGTFLGRNARKDAFNTDDAQMLFPAKLTHWWNAADSVVLSPRDLQHPIMNRFSADLDMSSVPWDTSPVMRHWALESESLVPDARIALRYSNDQPALVAREIGNGRTILMTTPVSDRPNARRRRPWNELLTGLGAWPSAMLCNEIFYYLSGSGERTLNVLAGQSIPLEFDTPRKSNRFQMFTPDNDWQLITVDRETYSYPFTEIPGTYRLKGEDQLGSGGGFSVNVADSASRLTRLNESELDEVFGKGKHRLARSIDQINRDIDELRIGREFYPFLLLLLAFILAVESLLANRFYKSDTSTSAAGHKPWTTWTAGSKVAKSA